MGLPAFALRRTLALVTAGLATLAFAVCSALVVLTTWLHQASATLADAVESVQLAQGARVDLLRHKATEDPEERRRLESELLRQLSEMPAYAADEGGARLAEADEALRAYLAVAPDDRVAGELRTSAHRALDALASSSVSHSRRARQEAARWDRLANALGLGTGGVVVLLAGMLLWWLKRALRPVIELADVIARFAHGERSARAEERGPVEIRQIAARFNEMASVLTSQRREQIAFLAGVAHDLRSPLSALAMSVGLLSPDGPLPSEARVRSTARTMRRQITRLDRMIEDLLEMTKIEAGHLALNLEVRDIGAVVADVVELFGATSAEAKIDARTSDAPIRVSCDAMRIEQVVSNLVSNAIKYSPSHRTVDVDVYRQGEEAVIAVTDHGIGISPEDQARIFEPFRRVGLSRETIPGIGLGLFIVRRIVEAHGGRVEVESSLGRGSRFRVLLPVARERAHDGAPIAAPSTALGLDDERAR